MMNLNIRSFLLFQMKDCKNISSISMSCIVQCCGQLAEHIAEGNQKFWTVMSVVHQQIMLY